MRIRIREDTGVYEKDELSMGMARRGGQDERETEKEVG